MEESKVFNVDLSKVTTHEELHKTLQAQLELPDYYGGNLDALNDCLGDLAARGSREEPVSITFHGYKYMKRSLDGYFYAFRKVVEDAALEHESLEVHWRRRA